MNMNYTAIDGIRTVEDLKAEKNQPVGGGELFTIRSFKSAACIKL